MSEEGVPEELVNQITEENLYKRLENIQVLIAVSAIGGFLSYSPNNSFPTEFVGDLVKLFIALCLLFLVIKLITITARPLNPEWMGLDKFDRIVLPISFTGITIVIISVYIISITLEGLPTVTTSRLNIVALTLTIIGVLATVSNVFYSLGKNIFEVEDDMWYNLRTLVDISIELEVISEEKGGDILQKFKEYRVPEEHRGTRTYIKRGFETVLRQKAGRDISENRLKIHEMRDIAEILGDLSTTFKNDLDKYTNAENKTKSEAKDRFDNETHLSTDDLDNILGGLDQYLENME